MECSGEALESCNMEKVSILFVCLGNICRSPLAEGIFRHIVVERKLQRQFSIDSCGLGNWHEGSPPHDESIRVAEIHGISIGDQVARQITRDDFLRFDLFVAMDKENRRDLKRMNINDENEIVCLREYDSDRGGLDVPDPYYGGGRDGFERVFEIIYRCSEKLLDELLSR